MSLRTLRQHAGLTQSELGKKLNVESRCRQQLGAGREQAPAEIPPAPCPGAGRFRGRVKEGVGMKKNLRAGRSGLPERGTGRS